MSRLLVLFLLTVAPASAGATAEHVQKPHALPDLHAIAYVADFTGDGQNDLLSAACPRDVGEIRLFPGTRGRWSQPIRSSANVSGRVVKVAGVLAAAAEERRFVTPRPLPLSDPDDSVALVADFTGDGRNDVLYPGNYRLRVVPAGRDGYGAPIVSSGISGSRFGLADFNRRLA